MNLTTKFFSRLYIFEKNLVLEIKSSKILIAFMYWAFFSFCVGFSSWVSAGFTGPYSKFPCWPHFTECKNIFPLTPLPYSYLETIFYTLLLALITYGFYNLYHKRYLTAYYCLLILWLWKFFVINVTYGIGNFDYYDLVLVAVFLFFRDKKHYLKLTFVLLYFLASSIKIGSGWIDGTYFTSLQTGLPIFSDALAPITTNVVILMQIVGCWFLLSKNEYLYRFSFYYFVLFHLYSTILVGYRYPLTALFVLFVLFGLEKEKTTFSDLRPKFKNIFNYFFIVVLFILQFIGLAIPGNQKITLEGNNYGLYMFEANHQCISKVTVTTNQGNVSSSVVANADARNRCDPYLYLTSLKKNCTSDIEKVSWTFDHSINGDPFYRIIDLENICNVVYKPFIHNDWINIENPPYIANTKKNILDLTRISQGGNYFEEKINDITYQGNDFIKYNDISQKTKLQVKISDNAWLIILIYWIIWFGTLISVLILITKKRG